MKVKHWKGFVIDPNSARIDTVITTTAESQNGQQKQIRQKAEEIGGAAYQEYDFSVIGRNKLRRTTAKSALCFFD